MPAFFLAGVSAAVAAEIPRAELDACNVAWDSPSADAKGSMPLGNGDIGLNVWVDPAGDLRFHIGKTDAWDENMRLVKVGSVRVKLTPALIAPGKPFTQTLDLATGTIRIRTADTELTVRVDANRPVVDVQARSLSGVPISAEVFAELSRPKKIKVDPGYDNFPGFPAFATPDTRLPAGKDRIGWYHANTGSPWLGSLKLQKLDAGADEAGDPLRHRIFGAVIDGDGLAARSDSELVSAAPSARMAVRVHVLTEADADAAHWTGAIAKQVAETESKDAATRAEAHGRWWTDFWNRSWIFVKSSKTDAPKVAALSRAYALQRFVNACAGRGAFPIKFNGSLFVVGTDEEKGRDADYRLWGGAYWFQNTRLPYWSMLDAGDYEMMPPLFKFYERALPLRKQAAKTYYGHDGAFFPETMTLWGTYTDLNYGMNRQGKPDGLTDNRHIRYHWESGIELVALMLDYYDHTGDTAFRDATLIPMAKEIVTFYDRHWKRDTNGRIVMDPAQALEAWWAVVDPTPEISGLRSILPRLLPLTSDAGLRAAWEKTLSDLAPLAVRTDAKTGVSRLVPGGKFSEKHNAVEVPELYPVFPFRLASVAAGKEALELGRATWATSTKGNSGWQQTPIFAAMLGLPDEAAKYLLAKAGPPAKGFRFPAFWGPNYDWMPDQDHGTVLMSALQRMTVQYSGDKIILLPAWPKDWEGSFKLHVPGRTTVEGAIRNGKVEGLIVTPESRTKDVVIGAP